MKTRFIALIVAVMLFCLPFGAMAEAAPILTVTGSAEVTLPADTAVVCLGVRETAADVRDAQANVNNKIADIRNALLEMGIENSDIVTNSLYINANYDYSTDEERVISYTATNMLKIVVKSIADTAAVIDTAFGAGANNLDYVSFLASDDSEAYDEAYRTAVADAQHKAEVISGAAGMKLDGIIDISEGNKNVEVYYERPAMKNVMEAAASDDAGTDIQAAGVTVSATVTLVYSISK